MLQSIGLLGTYQSVSFYCTYLIDGIEVDVYNFVEILCDDFSDLFEFIKVEGLVLFNVHVDCNGGQVTHCNL